jgi:hypothetical protein
MTRPVANPGSADAIGRGCICDFIRNDFGRGKREPDGIAFHCAETCAVHGVLRNIVTPMTETGGLSQQTKTALDWLRSRTARPSKKRGS